MGVMQQARLVIVQEPPPSIQPLLLTDAMGVVYVCQFAFCFLIFQCTKKKKKNPMETGLNKIKLYLSVHRTGRVVNRGHLLYLTEISFYSEFFLFNISLFLMLF